MFAQIGEASPALRRRTRRGVTFGALVWSTLEGRAWDDEP
jgi:hypothetical protein